MAVTVAKANGSSFSEGESKGSTGEYEDSPFRKSRMQENEHGLKHRAPQKQDQRFITLSPAYESYDGPQYDHNPVTAGELPGDPAGFFPRGHDEIKDKIFRSRSENRGKKRG